MPSDPHIPLMCGLYQAFYGSNLPIAADSPCLCLRRYLLERFMLVLTGQLRLVVWVEGKSLRGQVSRPERPIIIC